MTEKLTLIVIDDHILMRSGLSSLAAGFEELTILAEGSFAEAL